MTCIELTDIVFDFNEFQQKISEIWSKAEQNVAEFSIILELMHKLFDSPVLSILAKYESQLETIRTGWKFLFKLNPFIQ